MFIGHGFPITKQMPAGAGTPAFDPLSLSPALWLSPAGPFYSDLGTTQVTTDGSAVRRWADISGNGRHADAANDSARPILSTADSGLVFDGVDDRFSLPNALGTAVSAAGAGTLVIQCKQTASVFCEVICLGLGQFWYFGATSYRGYLRSPRLDAVAPLPNGTKCRFVVRSDASAWRCRVDAVDELSTAAAFFCNTTDLALGAAAQAGTRPWPGLIYQVFVFNRVLSDSEVIAVEDYMGA